MSISDKDIERVDSVPNEMIEMRVSGLGNLSQNEKSLVVLLTPADEGYSEQYNNGKQMVFPIAVPSVFSTLYFYRITSLYKRNPVQDDLITYYSRVTNTMLTHVSIVNVSNHLKGIVHFRYENGRLGHFEANLPNIIYTAIKYDLGIYLEQELLLSASKSIKVSYLDDNAEMPERVVEGFELISNYILDGVLPEDVEAAELEKNRTIISESEKNELLQLALQHEGYEWAEWLRRKDEGDEE